MVYRASTLLAFTVGFVLSAPTENCEQKKQEVEGNEWAFIVAGSNTSYGNDALHSLAYSIQASAYHAYHTLLNRGIPAERIVLFSYDDAAFIDSIPKEYQGQLFNGPDKKDVRAGVAIDYKGNDVNKANILAALSGNKAAIKGGNGRHQKDKVFVYFMNHGSTGAFWLRSGDESISKKELQDTLKQLHADGKYSELTFYMDACQSGSMFDTLPSDLNIYVVTSASPAENANAVYCPPLNDDTGEVDCPPDDKTLQCVVKQCLAPLFSAAWLHDLEQSQSDETLQAQFESLKEIVAKSPDDGTNQKVSQYGNKEIAKEPITDFEGKSPSSGRIYTTQDALRFTGVIGNLCESGFSSEHIVAAMDEVCA